MYLLKLCFLKFFNKPHVQIIKVRKKGNFINLFRFFSANFYLVYFFPPLQIFQIKSILLMIYKTRGRTDYKKSIPLF